MNEAADRERWWPAWLGAAIVLVPLVVYMQQFTRGLREATLDRAPAARVNSERLEDPGVSQMTVSSKMAAKLAYYARRGDVDPIDTRGTVNEIDGMAVTRPERLRAAILAGELLGPEKARERLAALQKEAEPEGDLARELHWLGVLYRDGRGAVPADAQDSLVDRHGWFGRLALSQGMPDGDPYRQDLLGGLERVGRVNMWLVVVFLIALIVGLFTLGALWSRNRQGLLERGFQERPAKVLYLEVFTLFVGGFMVMLGLALLPFGMGAEGTIGALAFHEFLLWSLVAVLAWPLVLRVPWRAFANGIGLTPGAGVGAEVGFGMIGYLAGLPLFVGAAILASYFEGEAESGPEGVPLFEPPEAGSWALLLMGTLSAVVWAPVLEECVFRGALYRWMRGWVKPWVAIPVTAAVFGLVHPYTPAGLIVVAVMGLMFGALREWRGSLIAPITAHFLHNATISLVTIGYLIALGD